jgi:hypothetical protein
MRYLALRRRADLLLAGLGADRSQVLRIVGGLEDDQAPPPSPPLSATDHPELAEQPQRKPPGTAA